MADLNSMWKVFKEPNSIKLPESMEMSCDLKNGKSFAIDIGCSLTKIAYYSTTKHKQCSYNHGWENINKVHTSISNILENQNVGSSALSKNREISYETSNKGLVSAEEESQIECNQECTSQNCSQRNCEVDQMFQLHFIKFQTKYLDNCLDFLKNHIIGNKELLKGNIIKVTGGECCKFADCIKEKLGVLVDNEDEVSCLIKGTNFLLKNVAKEAFVFQRSGNPECIFENVSMDLYPYLLVNIGAGVSVIKVMGEESYEQIGRISTGGATFWGLGALLTSAEEYDDLLELAECGDSRKVDMLVKDIFGGNYNNVGLPGDIIAASFGKICGTEGSSQKKFSESDIAKSLLLTILNNIGQVASLYATMNSINRIYFGGYFLRNNPLNMDILSRSVNYWSDNKIKVLFLRHEGYLGTIGAFLKGTEQWSKDGAKIYSGGGRTEGSPPSQGGGNTGDISDSGNAPSMQCSSGSGGNPKDGTERTYRSEARRSCQFSCCPLLLSPETYRPDTVDLLEDEEAREYWLECFKDTVEKFAIRAADSEPENSKAKERARCFKEKILWRLGFLRDNPSANGELTVRSLLNTIAHYLYEFEFPDPYLRQKQLENRSALELFTSHIADLDALDIESRQRKLIIYLLAGNLFDWGAKEVTTLLGSNNFGFNEALERIPQRPWLMDSLDEWLDRLKGPPHKCAVVFVDNSGLDIVLGVFPFVRELLQRGTEVIICSNSAPALNDVTHIELLEILEEIKELCPVIKEAEEKGQLSAMETGQTGPCLDLRHLNKDLCEEMRKKNVDLIVIEGMGRCVHTNLNVLFNCDSLKVAVIKNRWLAERLGGDMFCVICQYDRFLSRNS